MGIHTRFPQVPDWDWLRREYPGDVLLHVEMPVDRVAALAGERQAYLATPYSLEVMNDDMQWDVGLSADIEFQTSQWVSEFAAQGVLTVSPILLACAACFADFNRRLDPLDDAFWSRCCQPLLVASGHVIVPPMQGWQRSRGVWREVCWALQSNVPVWLVRDVTRGAAHG